MAKKDIGRKQKSKASSRKEMLQNCKKMATACMKQCKQKALQVKFFGISLISMCDVCLLFSESKKRQR